MKVSVCSLAAVASIACLADAFTPAPAANLIARRGCSNTAMRAPSTLMSTAEEAVAEAAAEEVTSSEPMFDLSTLKSDRGVDYVPLLTLLSTGDFKGADQFTRDALIQAAGEKSVKQGFVYWSDVKNIPNADLATMERLWLKYSGGKFGYSVQKEQWRKSKGDFENFCRRIGWNTKDEEVERKLRWFGKSEFIYDVEKAPKGHLPLTSALRGTQLLKSILTHPVWDEAEFQQ